MCFSMMMNYVCKIYVKKTWSYYFSDGQLYEFLERKPNSTFKLLTLAVKGISIIMPNDLDKLLNVNGERIQLMQKKGRFVREKILKGGAGNLM